ncbi:hypothetical protein Tco_1012472 [Tanacetum coccineum]
MYPNHTKIINSRIDDDQINSNIQFDSVKGNVNSSSVEKDTHVYDQCALETLARNAYDEAAKQQRFAQKVQQQNITLTSQIKMYKERNRVLENITKDNNYLKEFLEADERVKRVQKQAESQLYRDRDIIRDLEKHRDKLIIIMAQQQHAADVHPDELCPPNKRHDLMDANKKVELEHVQCPSKSKILMNIIKNLPLRFSICTLDLYGTVLAYFERRWIKASTRKELTLTLDDFRTIFHLPQANDNNHASFVPPPSFSYMVPFYKQVLGFIMELKTVSNFKISGLLQPWQTLCKIFSKCLTTRVTRWDQLPLQIMQMLTFMWIMRS